MQKILLISHKLNFTPNLGCYGLSKISLQILWAVLMVSSRNDCGPSKGKPLEGNTLSFCQGSLLPTGKPESQPLKSPQNGSYPRAHLEKVRRNKYRQRSLWSTRIGGVPNTGQAHKGQQRVVNSAVGGKRVACTGKGTGLLFLLTVSGFHQTPSRWWDARGVGPASGSCLGPSGPPFGLPLWGDPSCPRQKTCQVEENVTLWFHQGGGGSGGGWVLTVIWAAAAAGVEVYAL